MWILGVGKIIITVLLLFFLFGLGSCLIDDRSRKTDRIGYLLGMITHVLAIFYIWI